uniref:Uncharacterized protein n=1 Tax=mine drainage metagenome TaxID=410659 RepID=E6QHJ8_9ZZZZ
MTLPTFLDRERVRILPMDHLHVTRAHARPSRTNFACHIPLQTTTPTNLESGLAPAPWARPLPLSR